MKAVMYHYIRTAPAGMPYFRYLHVDNFIKQLDNFESRYTILGKAELLRKFKEKSFAETDMVLTFDDAFSDHYDHVYPILRERGYTGIFFVPTGPVRTGKMLDVHCIQLLTGSVEVTALLEDLHDLVDESMLTGKDNKEFKDSTYRMQTNIEGINTFKKTVNYYLSYEHRSRVVNTLARKHLDIEAIAKSHYATLPQLVEMADNDMILGNHTANHLVLSKLNRERQETEISEAFDYMERYGLIRELKLFAYPYGGFYSFNDDTHNILRDNKVDMSFNTEQRDIVNTDWEANALTLPRFNCNSFEFGSASMGANI